jgi:hypothetical protein
MTLYDIGAKYSLTFVKFTEIRGLPNNYSTESNSI